MFADDEHPRLDQRLSENTQCFVGKESRVVRKGHGGVGLSGIRWLSWFGINRPDGSPHGAHVDLRRMCPWVPTMHLEDRAMRGTPSLAFHAGASNAPVS